MSKDRYFKVAPDVWGMKIVFVNIYMVASDDHWVLIDTGIPGSAAKIEQMAEDLFGGMPPAAILLTHGHFDHRGAAEDLLKIWQVPIYAHEMELPYLTGKSAYPPPDPTVGGGLMSLMSFLYPKRPIDLRPKLTAFANDAAPYLPEWEIIYTPGHSPGHISLFRKSDSVLIAGDAFVTTKQESAIATLCSQPYISGPPKYFTYDWGVARNSFFKLLELKPETAATGHGPVISGDALKEGLERLRVGFNMLAKPRTGRYVQLPAIVDASGVRYVPPTRIKLLPIIIFSAVALLSYSVITRLTRSFKYKNL